MSQADGREPVAGEEMSGLRRQPSQRRARERVARILDCATAIIAERGSDGLRMSEVAAAAEVSIGSLYQYFPDKSALMRTLLERSNEEGRHCIEEGLAGVDSLDDLCRAFVALIDLYYAIFLAEPAIRDIRSGAQADKALRDLDLEDSRANGSLLERAIAKVKPNADPQRRATSAFFIMHMGEATMRLAISVPQPEGQGLVETYKRMALAEIRRL